MIDPVTDRALWGVVALAISLIVLVIGILYAATWRPEHEPPRAPATAEEAYMYTCYCHREPVHITLRASELPRRQARGHWRR
ncbi:hypothetical protein OIE62_21635 [Streptomyces scopuliridis]|uniref:Uncharacterized protein n=1 Tax=Streptomyces scopuliridis TaxID=452529 RepID=A0ACD4ZKD9_9ACTN|nr:hypothetical protein [Streptomyces scopuliridis]WSB34707.1 hypothetical protein OG949_18750 [Streptomyces scopuliridis]WSB98957.1 hypothetical protein OG835_19310 [Streptomyces scopuliridis]WSC07341.1 hypothetical protein OIE62_21635 [Streptomyces scopuliridis]